MEALAKKDLADELALCLDITQEDSSRYLDTFISLIKDKLLQGKAIQLKDFATIKVVEEKARIVKDPKTGHQYITPARNVVVFTPSETFKERIEKTKLSSIILAVPQSDPFARVIEFHFSRVGWKVHIVNDAQSCLDMLKESGAYLCIVDSTLKDSERIIEEIKTNRATSLTPLIVLYPKGVDPDRTDGFRVCGDEHLVEPFEVYTLLTLAESELARSSEEEVIFEQQVHFQFATNETNLERANELAGRLFKESGLDEEGQVALGAAFREAIGNAAQHGNKYDPKKQIKVLYLLDHEKITIVVTDEGAGFDHEVYTLRGQTKDAVGAARERHEQGRLGGLGIMLMMKCTDKMEYNDVGNMIMLTKYLPKKGE
ncbi:MAG: hypothetical protein D6805_09195 [Planctomycetota bacterium]|nr:MAG: hypothetical protein D6805_09195 [Planctomycetota bacterium]